MKNLKPIFILLIIAATISHFELKAQKFKINTKGANIINNKLVVAYDFTRFKQKQSFIVSLEIKNSAGNILNVKSVGGDVGMNIPGGENKQIVWDFLADNIVIDDNIAIEVKAELMVDKKPISNVSTGKALMLSAIVPGLGLSRIKQKNAYLLLGAITYGSAILSYVNNKSAYNNYTKYLSGGEISSKSDYYSKSKGQKSSSNLFKYMAIGTWTVNMVWTLVASKSNNPAIDFSQNRKIRFNAGIDTYSKTPVFMFAYRF